MKIPSPKPDPNLLDQEARAKADNINQIQDDLGTQTLDFMRRYGAFRSLNAGSANSAMSSIGGMAK